MEKTKQKKAGAARILAGAVITVLAMAVSFAGNTARCQAAGNTYETAVDAGFGESFSSLFHDRVASSPLEEESPDGVDTASGHLIITRNDLSLEGTGGMDFELNRYYGSNEAIIGNPTTETVATLQIRTKVVTYKTQDGEERHLYVNEPLLKKHKKALKALMGDYTVADDYHLSANQTNTQRTKILSREDTNVYGLASGWKFDLPWIETITITEEGQAEWGARPAYLHFGSIGTMEIEAQENNKENKYEITGFADYDYSDVKLEDWEKTVDGIQCRYLLRDKTGLRTYFNADGVVVLQKDAHDNKITYTYTDKIYLKEITDSVGRVIRFHYEEGEDLNQLTSVTVEGTQIAGGVSKKTVKYTYDERNYTPYNSDPISGLVLKSAVVDGRRETYGYRTVERLMTTCGYGAASQRVSTNENYLLNKVTADGQIQHYEYRPKLIRGKIEREIVVQGYYVTREYTEDQKSGKKSDGIKYDFFQKRSGTLLRHCDYFEGENEFWQYGHGKTEFENTVVVSRFNPNKYKASKNKTMSDYTYKKSAINMDTLKLKKDTKKNVSIYIYNSQKMLTEEIDYGITKDDTIYSYDNSGNGSLVVEETEKSFGKKGDKAVTTKRGNTYDSYRNVLTKKSPKAYRKKNQGKEHLYTTTYTYQGTDTGYPAEDTPYSLCTLLSEESFTSAGTKNRLIGTVAGNGVDYASISEQRSINGGEYETVSKTDFQYDNQGNRTQGKAYPSYSADGEEKMIQNDYTYNSLGQQTEVTVTLVSTKNPVDNRTYTEKKVTYDLFGNELTYTDENGLVSKNIYDQETGKKTESIHGMGTEYESKGREYQSDDGLKTMTVDEYGRVTIDIQDAFGNTVISKDEIAGTWTESIYEYGREEDESEEDIEEDAEEEKEETAHLIEERTYTFEPDEKRFIVNEDGETVPNYYITGKGEYILSGSKHFYDDLGNEIGTASFMNGELDAEHCSSWSFSKNETEVTGEEDEAQTISTSYSKELNPAEYQPEVNAEDYYDQFNDAVLSETITKTVTDTEGNTFSQTSTVIRGENKQETVTTYESDDFGRTIKGETITKNYQDGAWLPAYVTQTFSTYDDDGNVSQTETKSRKEGEDEWQSQTVKTDYDVQGQVVGEYTPRGTKDSVATRYEYNILGQMIRSEIPQEKTDGSISYQKTTLEYDNAGNVTEKEEQIDSDRTARTEYTYDKRGSLVMVKNCLDGDKEPGGSSAQYVQYVYDVQGNKVRQFTGMTSPLTIAVSEVVNAAEDADTFSYAGKTYQIEVSGQKKGDDIREAKYEYDGKNQLVAFTDPEGRKETYTYDVNSNLTKMVDKNGNVLKNTYDYQNRLTEMVAKEKKTGKETRHAYTYNAYGEVAKQDDTAFVYDDVSGQVTKETTKLTKNKDVVKNYAYDSAGNKSAFTVKAGDDTKLSLTYDYDGESRLTSVTDEEGNEVVGYSYDTDGNLAERTVAGSSLTTTYTYDYQNRLTAMKNQTDSGMISEYKSEYLLNGQKSKEDSDVTDKDGRKSIKTATYTYDLLGRITKETKTGSEDISYTYDSNNNRKEMTVGNKVTAYKYNKNDELLRTDTLNTDTEEDSVVIYKNDKNGNQLATVNRYEIPSDKKDSTYVDINVTLGDNRLNENVVNHYNALNQLTQTLTKNYKVGFTYDAEGLRTSKTVNGEKMVFVWDGDQVVLELSEGGKVKSRYIRGNDLVYTDKGMETEKQFYVADSHGNVVQLTDENGKVVKAYEYDSFGNEVKPDNKDDNPFRYCGEYYDKETEEIYLRARYYQPVVGRFLTRDTYTGENDEPMSLHLYTYCGNDGVNAWDPSGHEEIVVSGGVYKKSKKMRAEYYWEFIEPALKKISELSAANKEKIIWLIADKGWDENDKKLIFDAAKVYTGVKVKFFVDKRKFINFFKYLRVTKREKIHSFTVFSHGEPDHLMFGYDYATNNPRLLVEMEDIIFFRKKSFAKDVESKFYSCRNSGFASEWHNHIQGKQTMAFAGRTNYAGIHGKSSLIESVSDHWQKFASKFTGYMPEYKPQKSKYYPTGKQMVLYTMGEELTFN